MIHYVSDQRLIDLWLLAIEYELSHDLLILTRRHKPICIAGRSQVATAKFKSGIFSYIVISQIHQHYKGSTVFEVGLSFEHLLEALFYDTVS
jgi:hypothetical protein